MGSLFVLTQCFVSLIFCRARVLFPQGSVSPPAAFSHRALPSFMNSTSALYLGLVPALVRTTAQKPSAVSGEAFESSHPQPRLLPLALCAVHRKEEKGEGRRIVTGEGEATTCRLSSGNFSACSLPVRGKAEILSQSRGRVGWLSEGIHIFCVIVSMWLVQVSNTLLTFMALLWYLSPFSLCPSTPSHTPVKARLETVFPSRRKWQSGVAGPDWVGLVRSWNEQ